MQRWLETCQLKMTTFCHMSNLPTVTPAPLQTLEKALIATERLSPHPLLMLFSTVVALPQTAWRLAGLGCVLWSDQYSILWPEGKCAYLTAANRHAGGLAAEASWAAAAKTAIRIDDLANIVY